MKCKQIILTAALFILMFVSAVTVRGEAEGTITDINVFTDYDENIITVKLETDTDTRYINLAIIKDSAETLNAGTIKDDVVYLRQQSEPEFEVPVGEGISLGKWYKLRAASSEIRPFSTRMYFAAKGETDDFLNKMSTLSSASDICSYLKNNYYIAGLENDDYTGTGWKNVISIFKNIRDKNSMTFRTMEEFADTLNLARAIDEVNNSPANDIETVFQKYIDKGVFEVDAETESLYEKMSSSQKKKVMSSFMNGGQYSTKESVENGFKSAILITKLNDARYDEFEDIIKSYSGYMSLNLSNYNQLTGSEKVTLYKTLAQTSSFNSISNFSDTLDEQSRKIINTRNTAAGAGGGTGGVSSADRKGSQSSNIPAVLVQQTQSIPKIPFDDIAVVPWAKDTIEQLYYDGVLSGIEEKKFGPEEPVTREQFVKMIVSALGLEGGGEVAFSDVNVNAWYYPYIRTAYSNGIISGIDDNTFGIELNIKREDIAVIAMRAVRAMRASFTVEDSGQQFTDDDSISDYAREAVMVLKVLGIMSGYEDNSFRPSNSATRAEAAMIISAVLNLPQNLEEIPGVTAGYDDYETSQPNSVASGESSPTGFDDWRLPDDVIASRYRKQIAEAIDLGLLEIGNNGLFGCENSVTRAELAHTAVVMLGMGNISFATDSDFYRDVDTSNVYYSDIQFVTEKGLMTGYDDRTFHPDEAADIDTMVRVLVNVLGYGQIGEISGSSDGYMKQAANLDLFDNISSPQANRETFAVMVMNALDSPVMTIDNILYNSKYTQGDDLLYAGMELQTTTGQVNTVGDVTLYLGQNGLEDNALKIGGTEFYFDDDIPAPSYLGFNVRVYYAEEKDGLFVKSMRLVPNKNKVLRISAGDIADNSTATRIYYETEDGKSTKHADISRSADILYNGRAAGADDINFIYDGFDAGSVVLIDSNADGTYDVIIVQNYETYIVDSLNTRNNAIYTKYSDFIELEDEETENIYIDGRKAQFNDLNEWDVLFVERDRNGDANRILVSKRRVSGKITSISGDKIKIDSVAYELNNVYREDIERGDRTQLRVGDTGVFSIDPDGRIAAVNYSLDTDTSTKYGYLLRATPYDNDSRGSEIKLYSVQDNKIENLKCAKKVKLNSISRDAEDAISDPRLYNSNGVVYQMIRYKQNSSGEVTAIDTAVWKNTMNDWVDTSRLTYEESETVSKRHAEEKSYFDDRTFTISVSGETLKIRRGNHSFGSRCYYSDSSRVLVVPTDESSLMDDNEYTVYGSADIDARSAKTYEISAYDDDDFNVSKMFIMRGATVTGNVDELTSVFTISEKNESYNELLDESTWTLDGIMNGDKITAIPRTKKINNMLDSAESGDIYQLDIDERNRISDVSRRFSINYMLEDLTDGVLDNLADGEEIDGKPFDTFDYHIGGDESNYEHIIGTVTAVAKDRCLISTSKNGREETIAIVYMNSTDFTLYDFEGKKPETVAGTVSDIFKGAIIYARVETGFLRDVVVYANAER